MIRRSRTPFGMAAVMLACLTVHAAPAPADASDGRCPSDSWLSFPFLTPPCDKPDAVPTPPPADLALLNPPAPALPSARPYMDRITMRFDFDAVTLTESGRASLRRFLVANQGNDIRRLEIRGHADRLGPDPVNDRLSQARVRTIGNYLTKLGFRPEKITTTAYGERQPATKDCHSRHKSLLIECLEADRRVEVIATGYRVAPLDATDSLR